MPMEMVLMDDRFFVELQKMSRENEMRSKLLIRGVKLILEEKKEAGLLKKILRRKKRIVPKAWE